MIFYTYEAALAEAERRARGGGDVAIRKAKSLNGKQMYSVAYVSKYDSDYCTSEIVRASDYHSKGEE